MFSGGKGTRDVVFVAPTADVSIVAHAPDRKTGQRRRECTADKTAVDQPSVGHKRGGDRLGNGVLSQSGRNIPERGIGCTGERREAGIGNRGHKSLGQGLERGLRSSPSLSP
jgi:hypothetical protein